MKHRTAVTLGLCLAAWAFAKKAPRGTFSLQGKVVLIFGGSRGLGLALAREFARHGARLALAARDPGTLEAAVKDVRSLGADAVALPCDVRDRAQVEETVSAVQRALGPIDVLVNDAGIIGVGPLETMRYEDFDDAMRVNYYGPLHAILAVLPNMRERRLGHIVNIASVGALVSVPHLVPYCASKFALRGLSEGMGEELARDGIVVTTVLPGLMRTGSPRNATFKGKHELEYAWFAFSDAAPLVSMSATVAARRIVRSVELDERRLVLTWPTRLASVLSGVAPNLLQLLLRGANRLLPSAPTDVREGARPKKGHQSESLLTRSPLNAVNHAAERQFHQRGTPSASEG